MDKNTLELIKSIGIKDIIPILLIVGLEMEIARFNQYNKLCNKNLTYYEYFVLYKQLIIDGSCNGGGLGNSKGPQP